MGKAITLLADDISPWRPLKNPAETATLSGDRSSDYTSSSSTASPSIAAIPESHAQKAYISSPFLPSRLRTSRGNNFRREKRALPVKTERCMRGNRGEKTPVKASHETWAIRHYIKRDGERREAWTETWYFLPPLLVPLRSVFLMLLLSFLSFPLSLS